MIRNHSFVDLPHQKQQKSIIVKMEGYIVLDYDDILPLEKPLHEICTGIKQKTRLELKNEEIRIRKQLKYNKKYGLPFWYKIVDR